jgi:hypothetical protein
MKQANTLEARKILNTVVKDAGGFVQQTWTDPVNWSDYTPKMRIVTFRCGSYSERLSGLANAAMKAAGYSNKVRCTGFSGEYLRVNAMLP